MNSDRELSSQADQYNRADLPFQWHGQPLSNILTLLASSPQGLSNSEAKRRLKLAGKNELQEAKSNQPWRIFARQFRSFLVWILVVASILSSIFGDIFDSVVILAVLGLNSIIGFIQEFHAEKSIAVLKGMTAPKARVLRENQIQLISATEVVQGDILELEPGDLVAADARLLEAISLQCLEAALTGEPVPVLKQATILQDDLALADQENMVFMGTSVANGVGKAIVVATGMNTEIGRIARLVETAAEQDTPLQKKLEKFGRMLVYTSFGIIALLFVLGLARKIEPLELFMTSVSLAVAAVPEGLPAIVTVALALGVMRMAHQGALVRRLSAVETLGSTTVICTDKTGTLTVGDMTVRELYVAGFTFTVTGEGYGPNGEIKIQGELLDAGHAALLLELANILIGCNNAHLSLNKGRWEVIGDPTEGALLAAGHKAGASKTQIEKELPRHHEIPFDSDRKRRTVVRLMPNGTLRAYVNGAADMVLERCSELLTAEGVRSMTHQDRTELSRQIEAMANRGLRILASAYRQLGHPNHSVLTTDSVENELVFVGLAGMYDPPRGEAKGAIEKCHKAGIRVIMITGDHPHTALAIGRELNIAATSGEVLSGSELKKLSDADLAMKVKGVSLFARVTAEDKLRIVRAWKANKAVVAMTGDGVNDAPALKGADIGIAMGRTGTEVTKQAADIVLTDDNFATLVSAVEEGRGIYSNIQRTLKYLLATNAGELLFMTLCMLIGMHLPLIPVQLLWINLVTDGLPALSLATGPIDKQLLHRKPRPVSEPMADRNFVVHVLLGGTFIALLATAVYAWVSRNETLTVARTYAFLTMVFCQIFGAFSFWSETHPIWRCKSFGNVRLVMMILATYLVHLVILRYEVFGAFLKVAVLSWKECIILSLVSLVPLLGLEIIKELQWRKSRS